MIKRRDHMIEILYQNYHLIKHSFLPFLAFGLSFLGANSKYKPIIITAFVIFCICVVVYSILAWRNKVFEINSHHVKISKGVYKKTYNEIPLSRIKSINTSDSLLKRMFNISDFYLEIIGGDEISFVLSNREIKDLKKDLFSQIPEETNKVISQRFNLLEYVLIALTNGKLYLSSLSICFAVGSFIFSHFAVQLGLTTKEQMAQEQADNRSYWVKANETFSTTHVNEWIIVLYVLLGVFVISCIINLVVSYLTYRNFKINNNGKELTIQYGLINKKNFVIPISHIRSIQIIEPALFQLFGYAQVRIDNIGLGHQRTDWLTLMPALKKNHIHRLLNDYLSQFDNVNIELTPDKRTIPYYLITQVFKLYRVIFMAILFYFFPQVSLVVLVLLMFSGFISWRHSGLTFNHNFLAYSTSTFFKRKTIVTLKKYVQTTGIRESIFTRKENKAHYVFSLFSESLVERYRCSFLDKQKANEFLNYIVKNKN